MKITKKSFQAFFTRASFAGLLLVGGATAVHAQVAEAEHEDMMQQFTLERIFSLAVPIRKAPASTEASTRNASFIAPAATVGERASSLSPSATAATDLSGTGWLPSFAPVTGTAPSPSATVLTSGTLTSTATSYSYSTAPWVLSTGDGPYPDLGGVATFNASTSITPGTLVGATTVTVNVSPTLSGITYNSPFSYTLAAGTSTSIIAATGGLTLNAQLTPANTPTLFQLANTISSPISGGGTAGLTKTGVGTVNLSGLNTFTGGTHINGGVLEVGSTAAVGDGVFGDPSGGISFNGGSLFTNVTGGLTDARAIFIDTGGATIYTNTAATFNGVISGPGSLTNAGFAAVVLTLGGADTYTGATIDRENVSSTTLSGNGSILATSSLDLTGTFTLNNATTNLTDRVNDNAPITVRGVNFVSTGNASATSSETIGAVTGASSLSTFLVTPGTGQSNSLTMASLARQNNSTFGFIGAGLGGTPGAGVANVFSTAAPTLTGGGGAAGTTTQSILPYAYGSGTATALTSAGLVGSSFVTYGTTGIRPLATAEYAAAFGGSPNDNVRITDGTTQSPAVAAIANSVLLAPATAAASALTGAITVTSGAFLYSPTADVAGTVAANLNFGTAEGIITNTSVLTLSGAIAGTGGVTYTTAYAPTIPTASITLTGTSTYTGNTTLNSGVIAFSGTVPAAGTPSIFGTSGTVVLSAGVNAAALIANAATTLGRDISSVGSGINYIGTTASGFTFTLNGNVSLANSLYIYGNANAAASAITFGGTISGAGGIVDTGLGFVNLNGNNTYSGGTTIAGSSTYVAGTNTAFGTGPIYITAATGNISGAGTAATTLANNLFLSNTTGFVGTAPLTFTGGVNLNGARTLTISNTALTTFSGVVTNGSITKGGTGAVALNSTSGNTFTGGFTNTGSSTTTSAIYANNTSGSAFGAGTVNIGASSATVYSTLAGSFSTSGAVSVAGRLSPGNGTGLTASTAGIGSTGQIAFGGNLTLSSATTSSLYMEIGGTPASGNFDQITVAGTFTLNGTVFIATINGYAIQGGDTFVLATAGALTKGTFTFNTTGATLGAGVTLTETVTGTQLIISAVPEPSTWAAVAAGLGILGSLQFARRRNRRA